MSPPNKCVSAARLGALMEDRGLTVDHLSDSFVRASAPGVFVRGYQARMRWRLSDSPQDRHEQRGAVVTTEEQAQRFLDNLLATPESGSVTEG